MDRIAALPTVDLLPFSEIIEKRTALLVTSSPAWKAVRDQLHFTIGARIEPRRATTDHWDSLISGRSPSAYEVVYAVGGGLAADAAKYLARGLALPLVVLPTALSVDAFLTPASGVRRDGCVYYVQSKAPERLVLDLETIAAAPAPIRAAGIADVLSIATGCWDWKFADEHGKNLPGMAFHPWAYDTAQSILSGALDCAAAAGCGDKDGLRTLFDCLALEVQLCNQLGHARPEEGSEHYFAYSVENLLGHGLPHGDLVGPGISIMARLQGQDAARLDAALTACHIALDRIPPDMVKRTLQGLPEYCVKHDLAYGLAHELEAE
jgi:glycerol-1-phosphate dehydrogenase [NAD(P)+]